MNRLQYMKSKKKVPPGPPVRIKDIKMIHVSKLVPNPKNPNTHPPEQIERIAQIIEHQGWRRPITVSKQSGFMVVGHGRLEAAKLRGWSLVPVSIQDYENDAAEYADMVADNALQEWSELDRARINTDMIEFGPDFEINLLGMKDFVLDPSEMSDVDINEKELDENISTDKECPSCGYKW
jgi:hypothetical protein